MGQVYPASQLLIVEIKSQVMSEKNGWDRKWISKYLTSLLPLRCNIGYANYVDMLTPFSILSFCIDHIVNLLIIKG